MAANKPVTLATTERLPALDAMRGAAVLGILAVNIHFFRGMPLGGILEGGEAGVRPLSDRLIEALTGALAAGTSLGLFAFLFGVGMAMQLSREAGGRFGSARILVAQRMGWLLLIGLAHHQFVTVDILLLYAILGFVLIILAGPALPPPRFWRYSLGGMGLLLLVLVPLLAANWEAGPLGGALLPERGEAASVQLAAGHAAERLEARALETMAGQGSSSFAIQALGWMLVGLAFGWAGGLRWLQGPARRLLRIGIASLVAGAVCRGLLALPVADPGPYAGPDGAAGAFAVAGTLLLVVGFGATMAGLCLWFRDRGRPLRRLEAVGRMALSAYLMQSVVVLSLLAIPPVAAAMTATTGLLLLFMVWGLLLVICPWWLRRFRFGPAEWLWRSLTYLRVQPLKVPARADSLP